MSATTATLDLSPERRRPSPALLDALDRQVGLDARTRQGLSSHLSMELIALDALGAPAERLEEMFDRFVPAALEPRHDQAVYDQLLGEVSADGIDATVSRHLPVLAEAPGSEWFHSMIRLAYALDAGHPPQVAAALADWTTYRAPLPGEPAAGGDSSAREVFERLADADLAEPASHADLWGVARDPEFVWTLVPVVVERSLDDLAAAVAAAHVASHDGATLHLVTGTQAARVVRHWIDQPMIAARFAGRVVQAAAAGFVASRSLAGRVIRPADAAELDRLRSVPLPSWDEVRAAAVASPDVHTTKLVYSCRAEMLATGDLLYAWLAAREVGLVG
jgi:hypothetical protein